MLFSQVDILVLKCNNNFGIFKLGLNFSLKFLLNFFTINFWSEVCQKIYDLCSDMVG